MLARRDATGRDWSFGTSAHVTAYPTFGPEKATLVLPRLAAANFSLSTRLNMPCVAANGEAAVVDDGICDATHGLWTDLGDHSSLGCPRGAATS